MNKDSSLCMQIMVGVVCYPVRWCACYLHGERLLTNALHTEQRLQIIFSTD